MTDGPAGVLGEPARRAGEPATPTWEPTTPPLLAGELGELAGEATWRNRVSHQEGRGAAEDRAPGA